MEFEKLLLPYQRHALQKMLEKKYSILMWSRQTGKSFVVSLFAVLRAIERKNHLVAIISPTERQSKELMEKVKRHVEFLKQLGKLTGDVEFFDRFNEFSGVFKLHKVYVLYKLKHMLCEDGNKG